MRNFISLMLLFILTACSTPEVTYQEKLTKNEVTYCLMGDTGSGKPAQLQVAQALSKENCDRIFIVGDIVYPKGIKNVNDPELQNKFISVYRPLNVPVTLVLGNHDYEGAAWAWEDVPKKYPWVFHPSRYFLQKINDICFIGLDSNLYTGPWLDADAIQQKAWLQKLDLKECRYKVAFAHHPYLSPEGPAQNQLKRFYEENVIGKVDALVTGHDHILADVGVKNGTRLLISGAGGQHDNKPGYLLMKVSTNIKFEFKEVTE